MATAIALPAPMQRRLIPRRLQSRLLLTYLAVVLLGLGSLIVRTGQQLATASIEEAEHNLELEALIVAHALREPLEEWGEREAHAGPSLDALLRSYAERVGARITVIDSRLMVLSSSDEAVPPHPELDHPEIVAAQVRREQHDIRWDEWRSEERLFVAAPIMEDDEEVEGIVQLSLPMAPLYAEIRRTWMSLVGAGAVVLLATAIVSLLLARQIAGPIRSLTAMTESMAAGDLDQQVTPAGPDEVERLGRAFNRMAGQVRETLARQQAFVANAAHELRSPLTGLQLRIEMLQRHGQDNPDLAGHYLRQMKHEVEHLGRLVEHLLTLSSLDENHELARYPLDLAPILYELADEMGTLATAAGLHLEVDVPPHLPAVVTHADPMRMLVRNLLDNAIKYTPAGGQVTLRATAEDLPPAGDQQPAAGPLSGIAGRRAAVSSPPGPAVVIQVTDTGHGIAAEHLPHIFDRFYRVDRRRSRNQGGAGLGLSLVESIALAHGGEVSVKSIPGKGSAFTVRLPTH